MNKKYFFKIITPIIVVIAIIFGWIFITLLDYRNISNQENEQNNPTAREATNWDEPFLKPIEVEFLDKEEKAQMNLADSPDVQLQVLEKDENGNVTAYKKVRTEEDVVHYIYDPVGDTSGLSTTTELK